MGSGGSSLGMFIFMMFLKKWFAKYLAELDVSVFEC